MIGVDPGAIGVRHGTGVMRASMEIAGSVLAGLRDHHAHQRRSPSTMGWRRLSAVAPRGRATSLVRR